jgi:DNA-directed RNA polymerase subunit H
MAKQTKAAKFNISEHILVPKHTKLNAKEKKDLLARYNITTNQLPQINMNDPAIRSLGARPGDVIKIERNSATAGSAVYYRGVIGE